MQLKTLMCPLPSTYPETADEQEDKSFLGITADKPERQIFNSSASDVGRLNLKFLITKVSISWYRPEALSHWGHDTAGTDAAYKRGCAGQASWWRAHGRNAEDKKREDASTSRTYTARSAEDCSYSNWWVTVSIVNEMWLQRTAERTQLDVLALVLTKDNIVISGRQHLLAYGRATLVTDSAVILKNYSLLLWLGTTHADGKVPALESQIG